MRQFIPLLIIILPFFATGQQDSISVLLKRLDSSKSEAEDVGLLNEIGSYYIKRDSALAERYLSEAIGVEKNAKNTLAVGQSYLSLGDLFYQYDNYESANGKYQTGLEIFREAGNKALIAEAYFSLARNNEYAGEPELAIKQYHSALSLSKQLETTSLRGKIYFNIAYVYEAINAIDSALIFAEKAVNYNDKYNYPNAEPAMNLGRLYNNVGDYDKGLNYLTQSMDAFLADKDTEGINLTNEMLFNLYMNNGEFDKAGKLILSNLKILKSMDSTDLLGRNMRLYGTLLVEENEKPDSAEWYFKQAIIIERGNKDVFNEAYSLLELGRLYLRTNRLDEAKENLDKSLALFESINNEFGTSLLGIDLCDYHVLAGNFELAEKYGTEALASVDTLQKQEMIEIYDCMHKAYLGLNDYKNAFEYFEKGAELIEEDLLEQLSESSSLQKENLENAQQDIDLILWENKLLKREKQISKYLQIGSFLIVLLLGALLLTIYRRNKEKLKIIKHLQKIQGQFDNAKEDISVNQAAIDSQVQQEIGSYLQKIGSNISKLKGSKQITTGRETELLGLISDLKAYNYMISHDLRQPIQRIKNIALILKETKEQENTASSLEYLNYLSSSTEEIESMIESMLRLSSIENEKLHYSSFSTEELVKDVTEELAPAIKEKNIEIKINNLPVVYSDRIMLKQVFVNLIDNAVKFSERDKKSFIKISCFSFEKWHIFEVEDNGIGLTKEDADLIFQPFKKVKTSQGNEKGLGIGLSIAKKIISKLQGRISVSGEKEKGSVFTFQIPENL